MNCLENAKDLPPTCSLRGIAIAMINLNKTNNSFSKRNRYLDNRGKNRWNY